LAEADSRSINARGDKVSRWYPTGIDDNQRAARQPFAVVHSGVRIAFALDGCKVGADKSASIFWAKHGAKAPSDLGPEGRRSEKQLICRPRQSERLQAGNGVIFNETEAH
jgi:hypothetical protein